MINFSLQKYKNNFLKSTHIDPILLLMIFALGGVGLLILYSASPNSLVYVKSQSIKFGLAFVIMLIVAQIDIRNLKTLGLIGFGVCIILLIMVLIFGVSSKGAQRWLSLGFFEFQPSELMKLSLPMVVSLYLSGLIQPIKIWHYILAIFVVIIPTILIAIQPDLGTSILIAASGFLVIFFAGISWIMILVLTASFATFIGVFGTFLLKGYQKDRIISALNPESDPLGNSYHIIQSKIAIGSGGIYGKGWQEGTQSQLEFLPERHTDFIFAVLAEEFGFLGVLLLFLIYFMITSRGFWIASQAKDIYSKILASGLSATFFLYFFVNVAMVSGVLPVVGLPLPLLSYGGTSLITMFIIFGILMSIYSRIKNKDK